MNERRCRKMIRESAGGGAREKGEDRPAEEQFRGLGRPEAQGWGRGSDGGRRAKRGGGIGRRDQNCSTWNNPGSGRKGTGPAGFVEPMSVEGQSDFKTGRGRSLRAVRWLGRWGAERPEVGLGRCHEEVLGWRRLGGGSGGGGICGGWNSRTARSDRPLPLKSGAYLDR